ncbi:MAG: Rne/Rng family ribonuclease [bacterium]|nr:Rne/Rng family ribonuclease [bacterium]MCP4965929.1 Rne/Rng family ribonuclease [bacterium]
MALFRKKTARVVRRGAVEEPKSAPKEKKASGSKSRNSQRSNQQRVRSPKRNNNRGGNTARRGSSGHSSASKRPRPHLEVVPPPNTARKQMLVRSSPHQTQIVVLEGPVLVEHYVARSDQKSLVGNVYLGKVRNVLPGMEAAFVDFGEGKNGVLYAGDVNYDDAEIVGKARRIEMVMKPGDTVLVQVVKDAQGHKGARLTNQISLAGRYLVLAPNSDVRGISRRLPDDERRRLRAVIGEVRPKGMGVIVRTAAEGASKEDIQADIKRLLGIWSDIEEAGDTKAPKLVHEEPPLVLRVIREHFTSDFRRLLVDDPKTYKRALAYLEGTEADLLDKVKMYEDELGLFERFHVEDQLRKALDRKVWLPSGGHLVIDRTEALTVVDVNTGRFVGRSNLEETVLQNNLEAAEEVARQLRLRDIGGIIVIDFIDMEIAKNRDAVLLRLREHLAKDKTRTQVFDVSNLGLVEMTRKNVAAGLLESFSDVCSHCNGRGVLLYEEAATAGAPLPVSEEA